MTYGEGTATIDQPFKYNGKELDQMHGLNWYDYEARMYNGYRFPTPDPLADKYPDLSPYAYCANNPVRFIDPDGQKIRIKYGNNTFDYNSLTTRVITYFAPDSYLGRVNNDINRLREGSSVLNQNIGEIDASEKMITIQLSVEIIKKVNNRYERRYVKGKNFFKDRSNIDNEAWIQYEPENWVVSNSEDKERRDPAIGLSHELGHGWDFVQGIRYHDVDNKKEKTEKDKIYKMLLQEITSLRFENEARKFFKVKKRTKYGRLDILETREGDL